ncbi:MAG: hypothetical protein HKN04_12615 [Rhodothermaceae bacterium]|nr:hypothetical protein [Rhodothermaceae bacterium]
MGARRPLILLVLGCAVLAGQEARAQPGLGAHRDTLQVADGPRFQLRTNVVPGSEALRLLGDSLAVDLDTTQYRFEYPTGILTLRLAEPTDAEAVLIVVYRVLDLGLQEVYARRVVRADADSLGRQRVEEDTTRRAALGPLFGDSRLRRSGSITRGLIAGNNRDVSVESGLRMELSGPVTDDVTVQAVLTDENTPIQPEGTTQQLSDFDRVYIQLDGPGGRARLGDVDLALGGSEFAAFSRKIQGAAVEARIPAAGAFAGGLVRAAGATTRGLFQSQDIAPIEGVQGPYRLRGRQGEEFIIVIAGSERVYLDGVLLTRGETNDYVIDYATGEVTFTPTRLITAERRITVDFEYTTSRFTRTLLVGEAEAAFLPRAGAAPRGRFALSVIREADGTTFGDELGLSEADLDALAAAGDGEVLVDGAERVPFDPESPFVLYIRRDTLFAGQAFPIFVPAPAEADSVFRVRFSRVADGTGQYDRVGQAVNGILFEWVGPTGGDYVPFRLLPKPQLRRLVDLRGSLEAVPGVALFGEWAGSTNDTNTLSALGADDDQGVAYLAGVRLTPTALLGGTLMGEVRHRVQGDRFVGFDRTRPIEFNRIWNLARAGSGFDAPGAGSGLGLTLDSLREATTEGALEWALSEQSQARLEAGRLDLGDGLFDATRVGFGLHLDEPQRAAGRLPILDYRLDYTASDDGFVGEEGTFLRQRGELRQPLFGRRLMPLLGFDQERRQQTVVAADSLAPGSFAFVAVRPGVAWTAPTWNATATLEQRREEEPLGGQLAESANATTIETTIGVRPSAAFTSDARVAYRFKQVTEPFQAQGRQDSESLVIRWTNRAAPLRRAIEVNTVYEALTERTPLLQETYLLVGPEFGEFVWRDGEGEPRAGEPDGVAQVDEFFPETTPLEGTYARTFVPSDELFPTIGVQAQVRLRLNPSRLLRDDDRPLARVLRQITAQTTLDVRERSTERDLRQIYLLNPSFLQQREPRITASGDTLGPATISGRFRLGQDVTLFPNEPRYGVRLALSHLTSTSRLAAGLETRLVQTARLDGDAALTSRVSGRLVGEARRNRAVSDNFATRTFDITSFGVEPQATVSFGSALGITVGLALSDKSNALAGAGQPTGARLLRIPLEARVLVARRLSLNARAERADVTLDGGSTAGLTTFELTEGRGPGTSYLWGVNAQYTINSVLRASLLYDGRAPANAPVIHTVRMQLSAVF